MWAVEYSVKQNAYNIDLVNKILEINIQNAIYNKTSDYQILFIGTYEECCTIYKELKENK